METKTASQWMDNCTVHVIVDCFSRADVRSFEYHGCWHSLEAAFEIAPWKRRLGNKLVPVALQVTKNLQNSYEAEIPGLKHSQLHAFRRYMTVVARSLVALGDWHIARVDFRLEIRSAPISVRAGE